MKSTTIIVLILLLVIIAGCEEQQQNTGVQPPVDTTTNTGADTTTDTSTTTTITIPDEEETKEETCEEWAESLIPEMVVAKKGADSCELTLKGEWGDGEPVRIADEGVEFVKNSLNKRFKLEPGKVIGESKDLYYLKNYKDTYVNLMYEKEVVNDDGLLMGTRSFEVSVKGYDEGDSEEAEEYGCFWYEYKLLEPEVTRCNKINPV